MSELAADGICVAVTCRVLKLARQPYYRWLRNPVNEAEVVAARRADALFDAHRDDPGFGYRFLADEARDQGVWMSERTAWKICSQNGWWSVFGKNKARSAKKPGPPVHDDLVRRNFTADAPNRLWLADITEHRTREGRALPLRHQGGLLQPDRRLLDRSPDEVEDRRQRHRARRRPRPSPAGWWGFEVVILGDGQPVGVPSSSPAIASASSRSG